MRRGPSLKATPQTGNPKEMLLSTIIPPTRLRNGRTYWTGSRLDTNSLMERDIPHLAHSTVQNCQIMRYLIMTAMRNPRTGNRRPRTSRRHFTQQSEQRRLDDDSGGHRATHVKPYAAYRARLASPRAPTSSPRSHRTLARRGRLAYYHLRTTIPNVRSVYGTRVGVETLRRRPACRA